MTRGLDGVGERDSSPPQRISIQGISGSGKTTLGRLLELQLGIPHLETDALVHGPSWAETPDVELRALVEPLVLSERWVIDSDYRRKRGTLVLQHADTVVWLDLPLRVCLRKRWKRTRHRITERERQHRDVARPSEVPDAEGYASYKLVVDVANKLDGLVPRITGDLGPAGQLVRRGYSRLVSRCRAIGVLLAMNRPMTATS